VIWAHRASERRAPRDALSRAALRRAWRSRIPRVRGGARKLLAVRSHAGWSQGERLAWERWAPLVLILPGVRRWSSAQRRALVAVIRAKGGPKRDRVRSAVRRAPARSGARSRSWRHRRSIASIPPSVAKRLGSRSGAVSASCRFGQLCQARFDSSPPLRERLGGSPLVVDGPAELRAPRPNDGRTVGAQ
jgi:hypothetical protein